MRKYKLQDITNRIYDGKHGDCEDSPSSGYYFISVKDLNQYEIDYSNARQIKKSDFDNNYDRTKLEFGDTIYANTGDTIGKSIWVQDNINNSKTSFQKSVAVLKPNTAIIEPRYLFYLLRYFTPQLRAAATGSSQKNLLLSTMRNFEVSIHNKEKQIRISSVLGKIDDKIFNNYKINNNLEELIYTAYMYKFGNKKANGVIGDIIVENSKSPIKVGEAKDTTGIYPFFTSGDSILEWNEYLVDGRNMFLNTGGNADVKFYVGKAMYSTDTWCITTNKDMSDYLYLYFKSIKKELNRKFFHGSGLKHLQKPLLKKEPIYIPSVDEIVDFNETIQPMFDTISSNMIESKKLVSLRDFLLPMLMNGQINVDDIKI